LRHNRLLLCPGEPARASVPLCSTHFAPHHHANDAVGSAHNWPSARDISPDAVVCSGFLHRCLIATDPRAQGGGLGDRSQGLRLRPTNYTLARGPMTSRDCPWRLAGNARPRLFRSGADWLRLASALCFWCADEPARPGPTWRWHLANAGRLPS
jgi:hypothetical protein